MTRKKTSFIRLEGPYNLHKYIQMKYEPMLAFRHSCRRFAEEMSALVVLQLEKAQEIIESFSIEVCQS